MMNALKKDIKNFPVHTRISQVIKNQKANGDNDYDAHAWIVCDGEIVDFKQNILENVKNHPAVNGGDWIYRPFNDDLQNALKRRYGIRFNKMVNQMVEMNNNLRSKIDNDGVNTNPIDKEDIYEAIYKNAMNGNANKNCFQNAFTYKKLSSIRHPNRNVKIVIGSMGFKMGDGTYCFPFGASSPNDIEWGFDKESVKTITKKKRNKKKRKRNRKRKSKK